MTRNGLITLAAMGTTMASTYVFHAVMARSLSTPEYGELLAIIATLNIVTVPIFGFSMALTRDVAAAKDSGSVSISSLLRPYAGHVARVTVVVIAGVLILSPWLSSFLQLSSAVPLVFLAILVSLTNVVGLGRAVLLGLHDFASVALNQVAEGAVRLASAAVVAPYGLAAGAGFLGYSLGLIAALLLVTFRLPSQASQHLGARRMRALHREGIAIENAPVSERNRDIRWASIILTGTFIVLLNSDLIVVKHFLSPDETGQYAAISTLAKGIFVIINAFDIVLFAAASAARADGSAHLRGALLAIGIIVLPLLAIYWFFAAALVSLFFGVRYVAAAPLLAPYGLAVTLLGLANLLARYGVAVGSGVPSSALVVVTAATICAFLVFNETLGQVVGVLLVTGVVTLGLGFSGAIRRG